MTPGTPTIDPIAGRTAIVTGGGSGLGRAIAHQLGAHGARLILTGRTGSTLEAVAAELAAAGVAVQAHVCDSSIPADVSRLREDTADEDISILVNNAGIGGPVADLVDITPDQWDEVFDINVRGVYLMCQAFLPAMIAKGSGDVINLASVAGKRPLRGRTPYAASKMAVIGLTATLAWEVGPSGVNVNSLSPGPVDGPRMTRNFALEAARTNRTVAEAEREYVSRSALQRLLTEDEVGLAVVAMLMMPGLAGADIDLSGGMVAR